MKLNFKKIASVLTGAIMLSSTMGFAAAASFPAPFVSNGASDAAVIVTAGTHTGAMSDMTAAIDLTQNHLNPLVTTGGSDSSTATGGDSYKLEKSSTKFHLGDTITTVVSTNIDDDELPTLLASGTYVDGDNDEFDYKQKVTLNGANQLVMFDDDDYKTDSPTVGFKITDGSEILNYTLDFTETPYWDDLTSTDLTFMGRTYYVLSTASNTTLTLLDSAVTTIVAEGESQTVDGKEVSIEYIGATEVKLNVDGEISSSLEESETYKLNSGTYIGIKDIMYNAVQGSINKVEFSMGTGKLKLVDDDEVQMNDEDIDNLNVYITNASNTMLDKITLQWKADDDLFITPDSEITMPGFGAIKMSFAGMVYPAQEKIVITASGDDNFILDNFPLKDTIEDINLLYSDGTNYTLIGKDSNNKLATAGSGETLSFTEGTHDYFVVSYVSGDDSESYLVRANNFDDNAGGSLNETDFEYLVDGSWEDADTAVVATETVTIGNVDFTVDSVSSESIKTVTLSATASTTNFHKLYSAEGMEVYLPWLNESAVTGTVHTTSGNETTVAAACAAYANGGSTNLATGQLGWNQVVNFTAAGAYGASTNQTTCTSTPATYQLVFTEENKDDTLAGGAWINVTLALDTSTPKKVYISDYTKSLGATAAEIGETDVERDFTYSEVPTEILFDKSDSPDKEITLIYSGSEVTADVYITSSDTVITPNTPNTGGQVLIYKDSEVSSFSDKNLIVVGGSCVNEVAAKLLGSDVPVCGADFTTATSVISGGYIIKVFDNPYTTGKIAMLVAGYESTDTVNAIAKLKENTVSTVVGTEVIYPTTSA